MAGEDDEIDACISCNKCVKACQYGAIVAVSA